MLDSFRGVQVFSAITTIVIIVIEMIFEVCYEIRIELQIPVNPIDMVLSLGSYKPGALDCVTEVKANLIVYDYCYSD